MRLATWNVNSVRTRLERILAFLERHDIDVLCMQETKVKDGVFPVEPFRAAGYEITTVGHDQWNGVAIVSRVGLDDVRTQFPDAPSWGDPGRVEARAVGATCAGIQVWSLYVPNGRQLDHPHYAYKLDWLQNLQQAASTWLTADPDAQIALVGDWNVAQLDADVWDAQAFVGQTHVTDAERSALDAFTQIGFCEVSRKFIPSAYTYWDYQQLRFPRNEGMRIDLAFTSPRLTSRIVDVHIDRNERKGKGASDHVPVILDVS